MIFYIKRNKCSLKSHSYSYLTLTLKIIFPAAGSHQNSAKQKAVLRIRPFVSC